MLVCLLTKSDASMFFFFFFFLFLLLLLLLVLLLSLCCWHVGIRALVDFSRMFKLLPYFQSPFADSIYWGFSQQFFIKDAIKLDLIIWKFRLHKRLQHTRKLVLLKFVGCKAQESKGKWIRGKKGKTFSMPLFLFEYLQIFKSSETEFGSSMLEHFTGKYSILMHAWNIRHTRNILDHSNWLEIVS